MSTTRFAPSPTGYLHLGHAYSALFASARGERFLLRVEDLDRGRCRPEFESGIIEDLSWLGLSWERPVVRQSDRSALYAAALERLTAQGLLYACTCTRKEIAEQVARMGGAPHAGEAVIYPGTCRHKALPLTDRSALRLDSVNAEAETGIDLSGRYGDVILARRDTGVAYHLAVVVDDAEQGVTLVTRGEDLAPQRDLHIALQRLLGLRTPDYLHHPLVVNADGQRLAKRDKSVTLRSLRASGWDADRVAEELFVHKTLPR